VKSILIIDDEEKHRSLLARIIRSEGYEVGEAGDCASGLKKIESKNVDVVLCDVKLPDGSGIDLVPKIKAQHPDVEIILLTAFGNIADSVQAMKDGAFDYIVKGNDNDRIIPLLARAFEKVALKKRVLELEKRVGRKYSFDSVLGTSSAIRKAVELARKVAATDASVLLTGETGTGKEVFAEAIHLAGGRSGKSFVALNCSAFSREILESELFGHKAGAFTGAVKDQKGLIAEADGGTLFLDEIGEMPLELQAKLLRVLETSEYLKVGETKPSRSDFRLIAATNRDLKTESEEQRFRSDLYFRLNVFRVELPALRERTKDIKALAEHFTAQFSLKANRRPMKIDSDFLEKLSLYSWPGNIRELKNVIERAVILAEGDTLTVDTLPAEIVLAQDKTSAHPAFSMAGMEKQHILRVLSHTQGNKAEAARLLEIGIATLYRKIGEYGL
jgi:two-component system, NtrC family, response regulator